MSAERIAARLGELARIGGEDGGGVTRLAYTAGERDAHAQFAAWAAEAGARCTVDAAGNSVAVFREGVPYYLVGSHLDTVPSGGRYDGAAGTVAGLEVAAQLSDVRLGVRAVAFAAEEGARFGRPVLGSSLAAGLLDAEALGRLRDAGGRTLLDAAAELDLDPGAATPWLGDDVACFFEIHIEQGRQLETGAARLGLVDAIAGSARLRISIGGRSDHSGATPMRLRADALTGASELVLAVEEIGRGYHSTVATVGRLELAPNNVTTIPGAATLWVDVREVDADRQRQAGRAVLARAGEIAERRGLRLSCEVLSEQAPIVLAAWPRSIAYRECARQGLAYRVLSSGGGHDAAVVARRAPSALIFIPCAQGISHSPREQADPADIALAVEVVCATIARTDALLAPPGATGAPPGGTAGAAGAPTAP